MTTTKISPITNTAKEVIMRFHLIRTLTGAGVVLALTVGLAGCANQSDSGLADATPIAGAPGTAGTATSAASCVPYPTGVVISLAVHENAPAPGLPPAIACRIAPTIAAGLPIGLIAIDGAPWQAFPPTVFDITGNSETEINANLEKATAQVGAAAQQITARNDGADYLAGAVTAADTARSSTPPIEDIVIIGSGGSDRGAIDISDDGMSLADPEQVANHVQATAGIPADTFADQKITLVSFGETSAPQPTPTVGQASNIRLIWSTMFEAYGATVSLDLTPRGDAGPVTDFHTTPFDVPEDQPFTPGSADPLIFGSDSALGFEPDEDLLRDEEAAIELLRPLAAWLMEAPNRSATITGTTASPNPEENERLSRLRAERIALILTTELGVAPETLRTVGAGYTASPDDHPYGVVEPGLAALNMTVRIQTHEGR